MKNVEIAETLGISRQTISMVSNGHRFTERYDLAYALGKKNRKRPITYIRPDMRALYLMAHPEMNKVVR